MFRKAISNDKPRTGIKNWTKICDYIRKTSQNGEKNYKNLESIDISTKKIILQPNMTIYFVIFSGNDTSIISISGYEKENSKIEDQNILIYPGHDCYHKYKNAKAFLENLFQFSNCWRFPCGILHYKILKNVCEN